jgi:hypothetical protein
MRKSGKRNRHSGKGGHPGEGAAQEPGVYDYVNPIRVLCPIKNKPPKLPPPDNGPRPDGPDVGPHPNDDVDFSWDYIRKEPIFEFKETKRKGKKRIKIKIRPTHRKQSEPLQDLIDEIIDKIVEEIRDRMIDEFIRQWRHASPGQEPPDGFLIDSPSYTIEYEEEDEREGGGGGGG